MGFSRQEYWSGLLFPSHGDLPNPGIKPRSFAFQADSLPSEPPGKLVRDRTNFQTQAYWSQNPSSYLCSGISWFDGKCVCVRDVWSRSALLFANHVTLDWDLGSIHEESRVQWVKWVARHHTGRVAHLGLESRPLNSQPRTWVLFVCFWTTFSVSCTENRSDKLLRKIKSPSGRPVLKSLAPSGRQMFQQSFSVGACPAPLSMSGSAQPPCLWRNVYRMLSTVVLRDQPFSNRPKEWLLTASCSSCWGLSGSECMPPHPDRESWLIT